MKRSVSCIVIKEFELIDGLRVQACNNCEHVYTGFNIAEGLSVFSHVWCNKKSKNVFRFFPVLRTYF